MNRHLKPSSPCVRFGTLVLCLAVVVVSFGGCASLRRKFTRKKQKKEQKAEFIPVLDPVDYPARMVSAGERYRYHYSLWKVWQEELIQEIDHKGSDKKQRYLLAQVIVQMEEMRKSLTEEKKEALGSFIAEFQRIAQMYDEPKPMRSMFSIKKKIESNGKKIRGQFRPGDVEGFLIQP